MALTETEPTLGGYGLALWDNNGNLLTGFNGEETVLREVFKASFSGPENTTISVTGSLPSNITSSNSIVVTNYSGGTGWNQINVGHIIGTALKVVPTGPTSTTRTGYVTVLQHSGASPGAGAYGLQVKNASDIVLDQESLVWIVKESGSLPTSESSWTNYGTSLPYPAGGQDEYAAWHTITLPASTYSTSKPFAVAVRCTTSEYIIQPYIFSNAGGYYQEVIFHKPRNATLNVAYQYAILVSPKDFTPISDGSSYGLKIYDTSSVTWSSTWRQGIVQSLKDINVFTTGVTQNGTYDYSTGSDGVIAPIETSTNASGYIKALHSSFGEEVTINGLNIDPLHIYAIFWACSGKVEYKQVDTLDGTVGGGQHWPAVKIINDTSVKIKMYRTADGPEDTGDYGGRIATSYHPTGHLALVRIL